MNPLLASLTPYEAALLLTTLSVGGDDAQTLLERTAEPIRAKLLEHAQALLNIDEDRRSALMGHELRALLAQQGRRGLEFVDYSWILHHLRGESAAMVALILVQLPPHVARQVLRHLPPAIRHALPPKHQVQSVPRPLASGLQLMFESRFDPMPTPNAGGKKTLRDLIVLERDELLVLVRDLGLTELGQAFAASEKLALVELLRRLPKKEARELIAAVKSASLVDLPEPRIAHIFLSRIVVNFDDTETFLRRSGLWRLARCWRDESDSFLRAMAQRFPRRAGTQLLGYVERARALEAPTEASVTHRLQDAIMVRLVALSREGRLGPAWAHAEVGFFDEAACQAALAAPSQSATEGAETDEPASL